VKHWDLQSPAIADLSVSTSCTVMGSATAAKPHRQGRSARGSGLVVAVVAIVAILAVTLPHAFGGIGSFPLPSEATLAGLNLGQRIVAIAQSQVGYRTNPSSSYCNKYSAYWNAGQRDCPSGERDEEWCADFAAWAWQEAGAQVTYGYSPGELNGAAVSFYLWGVAHGEWHTIAAEYVPAPGDVAVYGLTLGTNPSAAHVAIVTSNTPGQAGPNVVNGDGDTTGFSVVESGTDQVLADADQDDSHLAGYVSPPS
jgi:hypothetical protein